MGKGKRSVYALLGCLGVVALLVSQALALPTLRDLPYGTDPKHRLDVYLPSAPEKAPVIVLVHGGGWRFGDKANEPVWRNKVAHWTQSGAIVVSVNYRLMPQANPLEQAKDVARALSYVQAHAGEWGGAPDRLILMGHSAGGHLVALLSADPTLAHLQGARPWLGSVVLDTAALDIPRLLQSTGSRLYHDAFGKDPMFWHESSPLQQMQPGTPPVLLVCSTLRRLPCPQAQRFAKAAANQGSKVEVLPMDYSHRSINTVLGLDKTYTAKVDRFLDHIGLFSDLTRP
jgi:acetyl esterase/lipase